MERQIICAAGVCMLLFFCAVVESQETVAEAIKIQTQDSSNVFIVKEYVERLLTEVEILNKKSNSQINILKALQAHVEIENSNDGVCDRISSFFNSTLRKYNQFEDRIVVKLDEIQDEQTTNLNKILVRQNLSKNCQQGSALDIMSEAMSEMSGKIDSLETQLKHVQTSSDEQMKILKEINAKLSQHQVKFEHFEKQLPTMVQVSTKGTDLSPTSRQTLPMSIVLGMTQKQMPPKAK